jgi:ribosomal protein S18 acetylase RimI-like enzyme
VTLRFRFAGLDDVPALVPLVESAYRGDESRRGWTTEADLLDGQRTDEREITDIINDADRRLLLVEVEGELAGCCQLASLGGGVVYLGLFSVRPDLQGRGLGRAIVTQSEQVARQAWSAAQMRMTVLRQREELIAWYERRGYTRTGETEPFPYGNERFGQPKVAGLEFAVLVKPLV